MLSNSRHLKRLNFNYPLVCTCILSPFIINHEFFNVWLLIISLTILLLIFWKYFRLMTISNDYIQIIYLIRPFKRKVSINFNSIESVYFKITAEWTMRAKIKYYEGTKITELTLLFTKFSDLDFLRDLLLIKKIEYSSNLTGSKYDYNNSELL